MPLSYAGAFDHCPETDRTPVDGRQFNGALTTPPFNPEDLPPVNISTPPAPALNPDGACGTECAATCVGDELDGAHVLAAVLFTCVLLV